MRTAGLIRPLRLAALLALASGPAWAAQPIPLAGGTYCGPGDARIVVDVDRDQVTIDRMVCSFPVIAAGRLQSDLCSTPEGESVVRNFNFQVIGPAFLHEGQTYSPCGPAKTGG